MKTPETTLEELRAVLAEERAAIRRLDSAGIQAASRSKEVLIAVIAAAVEPERTPMLKALLEVRGDIKRNLVLLAHARDFVREAAETVRKRSGPRVTIQL